MTEKENRRGPRLIILLPLLTAAILIGGFFLIKEQLFYGEASLEAGSMITADDFVKPDPGFPAGLFPLPEHAVFLSGSEQLDVHVPGEYQAEVARGMFSRGVRIVVKDTVPPVGRVKDLTCQPGEKLTAEDFFTEITDETQVTASFVNQPSMENRGVFPVELVLRDLGNNTSAWSAKLVIPKVKEEVNVEAGVTLPGIEDFLEEGLSGEDEESAHFVTPRSSLSTSVPGEFPVEISVGGEDYVSLLKVTDTTPPTGEAKEVRAFNTSILSPEDFVASVEDATEVEIRFDPEPDMQRSGEQEVSLKLIDAAGNEGHLTAMLTLEPDTEPPVIGGVKDRVIFIGDPIAFKEGIICTDNCDQDIELVVDRSGADLEKEGTWEITYSAEDRAGNRTEKKAAIKVMIQPYDQEELDQAADEILASILTEGMTDYQKAKAIFTWIKGHIFYRDTSQKDNPLQAMHEGLIGRSGDCFVYAMSSKELLTRAGIKNMDIMKIPRSHDHFWNLVDVGTGWLHFDTTPRASDHPNIFLWTDEELMEYSGRHYGSHNYDRTAYPEVNGTKVTE